MRHLRGYLLLLVWLVFTGIELALAAPVRFEWDVPALSRGVTLTHLRERHLDGSTTYLASSDGTTATVDLPPGLHVVVATDFSPAGWSEFSDPVTVIVPENPPQAWTLNGNTITITRPCVIRITPQFSTDLKKWEDYDAPTTPFTRIKVTDP